ncbi:MAG: MFS transporter, partial [bacterium]|nr:MFS transporter [bacterium]
IDSIGESRALSINYAIVTFLFFGYAYVPIPWLLYSFFILDHLLIGFDVGITTHLDKICDNRADIAPSLAMGGTVNHITGVLVPIIGGIMWTTLGPQSVFFAGALICVISLIQAYNLPKDISVTIQPAEQ